VKIGAPDSAQAWVVKGGATSGMEAGESTVLSASRQAVVNFNNVTPLDVVDALNTNNKLEVVGTYTWAAEEDTFDTLSGAANDTASILKNSLNATLAQSSLPSTAEDLVDLIIDNLGDAFTLLLSNIIPTFGLADDTLGGAIYAGIGVKGTLGGLVDTALQGASLPAVPLLGDNLAPPNIVGGGLYTMTGTKTFTQAFEGADGRHTYTFLSGPA
jgi:hypothetical protein